MGSVVVGGIGVSEGGLRTTLPAPEPASTWVLPGGGDAGMSWLTVLAPGEREAPLRVRAQQTAAQQEVLAYASVDAQRSATFVVEVQDAGLVAEAAGREPFVAARRLAARADLAGTGGVTTGATTWVAMPATAPKGGRALLIVQNAGGEIAEARLVLLTATGRAEAPSIAELALVPGRTLLIRLADLVGEEPVSVLVEVERGALVVAQAAHSADGYAVALGAPIAPLR